MVKRKEAAIVKTEKIITNCRPLFVVAVNDSGGNDDIKALKGRAKTMAAIINKNARVNGFVLMVLPGDALQKNGTPLQGYINK